MIVCRKCPAKIPLLKLDGNVRKALALRLKIMLDVEQVNYARWQEAIKPRLTATRSSQMERMLKQRIQALKVVIWMLTPSMDREDDFPGFWKN
jgi:hypothetical protein